MIFMKSHNIAQNSIKIVILEYSQNKFWGVDANISLFGDFASWATHMV